MKTARFLLCLAALLGWGEEVAAAMTTYTITGIAGPNVSVDPVLTGLYFSSGYVPSSVAVLPGGAAQFIVTPAAGYTVNPTVGGDCPVGSWSGNTYTTGANYKNCNVSFSATLSTYTLAFNGNGGSVSPTSKAVTFGQPVGTLPTPSRAGYTFAGWNTQSNGSGGTWNSGTPYTAAGDTTLYAKWQANTYTVATSAGANGSISPSSGSINHGSTGSFTITPNSGYKIQSASGCGGSLSGNTYTTGVITGNCTVSATFEVIDQVPPTVTATLDADAKTVTVSGAELNGIASVRVVATGPGGQTLASGPVTKTGSNYTATVDLAPLPDGSYTLTAYAKDIYGNEGSAAAGAFTEDTTAPTVALLNRGEPADASIVKATSDLLLTASDINTADPVLLEASVTGGAPSSKVQLNADAGRFGFPLTALTEGEYVFSAIVEDEYGNQAHYTAHFTYQPGAPVIGALGTVGLPPVDMPGSTHAFHDQDGRPAIVSTPVMTDDVPFYGEAAIWVEQESGPPVVINGVALEQGTPVLVDPNQKLGLNSGRIALSAASAEDGVNGEADVVLIPVLAGMPRTAEATVQAMRVRLRLWTPQVDLQADNWSPVQLVEQVAVRVSAKTGSRCSLTGVERNAWQSVFNGAVCLVTWTDKPLDTEVDKSGLGLTGRAASVGDQDVAYELHLLDGDGTRVKVGEGRGTLHVQPPAAAISSSLDPMLQTAFRKIEDVDLRIKRSDALACAQTMDAADAKAKAAFGILTCLFEWVSLPDGIEQDERVGIPPSKPWARPSRSGSGPGSPSPGRR